MRDRVGRRDFGWRSMQAVRSLVAVAMFGLLALPPAQGQETEQSGWMVAPFYLVESSDGATGASGATGAGSTASSPEAASPGTDCFLWAQAPTKSGTGIRAYSYVDCNGHNYADIYLVVRLERQRWYGTQTLVTRTNSCGTCDYVERTAGPWDCAGQGEYTYWNHSNSEILDWQGQLWTSDVYSPTRRYNCP